MILKVTITNLSYKRDYYINEKQITTYYFGFNHIRCYICDERGYNPHHPLESFARVHYIKHVLNDFKNNRES